MSASLSSDSPTDPLFRFLLPGARVRGAIICAHHLRAETCHVHGLNEEDHNSPGELFAQTLIASMLLLSISKGGVRQVLQLDGHQGPVTRMLGETRGNTVRGYIDWNEGVSSPPLSQNNHPSPLAWLGSPVTISTVRDLGFGQPYVSTVQSEAEFLADMMVEYLTRSVQIRADVLLHHNTGLLLEAMPGCEDDHWFSAVEALAAIPDSALNDDPEKILKAFDPLGMKIVGQDDYRWHCGCDSEKMAQALSTMPAETLNELKDDNGMITVSCRYCGASHSLNPKNP
ncbi:MAG: Hsp33 family molecular chaperone HslO [Mariprofundaceae bacterium]|nr:Hsp33 family molecular chaperone HslO [Mariprofundaceae bacterium]